MKNKVLVTVKIPEIDESYDVYLPVNRKIGNIITLFINSIKDLNEIEFEDNCNLFLYSSITGEKYDIDVEIVSPLLMGGEVISSTEIRRCVREGEIAKANEMLGYHFGFCLEVEHGFQRGRTWDFPTINQQIPKGRVMPKFGVYCSAVEIDGNKYAGVTNIGVKPTVHVETAPLAETFIMDYHGDLYGRKLKLELHEFLRPEKMFDSFDSLREEIAKNKEQAVRYFEENKI